MPKFSPCVGPTAPTKSVATLSSSAPRAQPPGRRRNNTEGDAHRDRNVNHELLHLGQGGTGGSSLSSFDSSLKPLYAVRASSAFVSGSQCMPVLGLLASVLDSHMGGNAGGMVKPSATQKYVPSGVT